MPTVKHVSSERFMGVNEVAALFHVSRWTVWNYCVRGVFPSVLTTKSQHKLPRKEIMAIWTASQGGEDKTARESRRHVMLKGAKGKEVRAEATRAQKTAYYMAQRKEERVRKYGVPKVSKPPDQALRERNVPMA